MQSFSQKTLCYRFFLFLIICVSVYLSFRFLLPLFFPFLLTYLLMRILSPLICYQKKQLRFPHWLACTTTLLLFFLSVLTFSCLLLWQATKQFRLLFVNYPVYRQMYGNIFLTQAKKYCHCLDYFFNMDDGTILDFCTKQFLQVQSRCTAHVYHHADTLLWDGFSCCARFCAVLLVVVIGMIILCKELSQIQQAYQKSPFFPLVHKVLHTLKESGLGYLKAQSIIISAIWFVCSAGLMLIKNPYGIILGLGIAIFDAFPILGSGLILVPWGIFYLLRKCFFQAAILFTVYVITIFVREILEAKLIGSQMGISPFYMLLAIFVGIELFGVTGVLLGPFGIVLINALYHVLSQNTE